MANSNHRGRERDERYPVNTEAEKSILGAILLDNNVIFQAIELMGREGEDFFNRSSKTIYSKMIALADRGESIDLITLTEELNKSNQFAEVGSSPYLASLIDGVPRTDTIEPYCNIVKEKAKLRSLLRIARKIEVDILSGEVTANDVINEAEAELFDIDEDSKTGSAEHISSIAAKLADFYQEKATDSNKFIGLPVGYQDFDRRTSGLLPGVTIIAGRPGHCKTATALNFACNVALAGGSVYYASPESSKEQLVQRILASQSMIDSLRMREGRMTNPEWARLVDTLGRLSITKFVIDDDSDITPELLLNRTRRYKMVHGLDLLVVDYLQDMARTLEADPKRNLSNPRLAVRHVSKQLVKISKVLKVPVLALAQLSRAVDDRPDHRPNMGDLQESAAIEQDADLVLLLLREEKYKPTEANRGKLKMIFAKFRDGSSLQDIDFAFLEHCVKLGTLDRS